MRETDGGDGAGEGWFGSIVFSTEEAIHDFCGMKGPR